MALKSKIKVKVGDTGEILYIDIDREWILNKDGDFLMEIPKTADAIKIIRYLCSQYQNDDNGIVTNEMILKYLYMNDPVITKMHITKNMSKIRKIPIWNTEYTFADFIWSNNTGRFKILLAESPFDESSQCSTEMSDYAKYINETKLPSKLDDVENIFSFRFTGIEFKGRKDELNRLYSWLMQEHVSVWAVTGKGGSGKSRLALHIAQQLEKGNTGKAVWIDSDILEALNKYNDYSYPKPVLFICDYAARYDDKLSKLIDKMSRTQTNAKFLLIERSDSWYNGFLRKNDGVKERAIKEPIILDNLDFSPEEYAEIMKDFSDALYGKDTKQIPEPAQQQIIQKAKELSGKENAARCLFLLLVTDAYLEDENADIRHLNAQNLLHNYLERFRKIWEPKYSEDTIEAGYRILAYATACDGIPFSEMKNHPAIQDEWKTIKKQLKGRQQLNQYFQRICEIDEQDTVPALKPDLIGEFLFLNEWKNLLEDEQAGWLSGLLKEHYGRAFFAMCLADWSEEAERFCDMLSDLGADADQRVVCAKTFYRAVHIAQSEEKKKEYASKIIALDYDHSPAVLKLYIDALSFLLQIDNFDKAAEFTALLDKVEWQHYFVNVNTKEAFQDFSYACDIASSAYFVMDDSKANMFQSFAFHAIPPKLKPNNATNYGSIPLIKPRDDIFKNLLKRNEIIIASMSTEHPDYATFYNQTTRLYFAIGDYDKALKRYQKTLMIEKKELGKEHPEIAATYHEIALVYKAMGDYKMSLKFFQKDMAIIEKKLGKQHPFTVETYNDIAEIYRALKNYDKALEFYRKALTIYEKMLDPDTAAIYNNIANVYKDMGRYDRAFEFYKRALAIHENYVNVRGNKLPDAAVIYNNLAELYIAVKKYKEALKYAHKAEHILKVEIGEPGAEFLNPKNIYTNLSSIYRQNGYMEKALEYIHKAETPLL